MINHIPDIHALVLWNDGEDGKITGISIVDYRDAKVQRRIADLYMNSYGTDTHGWLTDVHPNANPAGLFAYLVFLCGCDSKATLMECVREFAKLEGCEWARRMLAVLERPS